MYVRESGTKPLYLLCSIIAFLLVVFCSSAASAFDLKKLLGFEEIDPSELVVVTPSYSLQQCSEDYPLHVSINNGSDETIHYTEFEISARRENYSGIIYSDTGLYTDRIVPPHSTYSSCWRVSKWGFRGEKRPLDELIWASRISHVTFADQ